MREVEWKRQVKEWREHMNEFEKRESELNERVDRLKEVGLIYIYFVISNFFRHRLSYSFSRYYR